jgi:RNA polymerase sigma-70 factor (sigma-E family)
VSIEESFREYVRARTPALSRAAYLLTGDFHLAEDLVQQALLRVAGRWERLTALGDPDPYVRRVLYTQHVSRWRRARLRLDLRAEVPEQAVPDGSAAVELSHTVRRALRLLTPRQRAVLVLRYFEDLSEAETAAILGCAVGTVKSQTRHALTRLRQLAPDLAELRGTAREVTR